MAAGAFKLYDQGLLNLQEGDIDYSSGTIVAILVDETYTPNKATHSTYADVSADELAGGGDYAPVVLDGKTITILSGDEVLYDCDNISFGNPVTITGAKYCILVQRAGGSLAAGDLLLGFADLNTDNSSATVSTTASVFSVNTPNGLFGINNVD